MNKIKKISKDVKKNEGVLDPLSWLQFDKYFFDEETNLMRKELRKYLDDEIQPMMVKYSENAEYPYEVVEKLKRFDLMKNYLKKPYGEG